MAIQKRLAKPSLNDIKAFINLDDAEAAENPTRLAAEEEGAQAEPAQPAVLKETPPEPVSRQSPEPAKVQTGQASATTEAGKTKGWKYRGNKEVVSCGFNNEFIPHLMAAANMMNLSRTAFINLACSRLVKDTYREYLSQHQEDVNKNAPPVENKGDYFERLNRRNMK